VSWRLGEVTRAGREVLGAARLGACCLGGEQPGPGWQGPRPDPGQHAGRTFVCACLNQGARVIRGGGLCLWLLLLLLTPLAVLPAI
jgi:hypothetical protein